LSGARRPVRRAQAASRSASRIARAVDKNMAGVREMVVATKVLVEAMHAALAQSRGEVAALRDQVMELMETRAEVERLRAQASAAVSRAEELSDEVAGAWELIKQLRTESLSQDVRIADLEALEGYGWRAPPVYAMSLPKLDHGDDDSGGEVSFTGFCGALERPVNGKRHGN
jgi:predicted RNase H-like nuclease (RuvC/YqgF family)